MRYLLATIFSIGITACATSAPSEGEPIQTESEVSNLPPQNLASGECGLFIWTAGETRNFIGFESQAQGKIILGGEMLGISRLDEGLLDSEDRQYQTEKSQLLSLSLQKDQALQDGVRFRGRLSSQTEEGWDKVTPVIALTSCVP